jgi:uncharacterized CHY-type Zn-finger protein
MAKVYREKHEKTKLHIKNLSIMICSKCNRSLTKENYFEDKWNKFGLKSYCKAYEVFYFESGYLGRGFHALNIEN